MKVLLGVLIYLMIGVTLWVTGVTKPGGCYQQTAHEDVEFRTNDRAAGRIAAINIMLWFAPLIHGFGQNALELADPLIVGLGSVSHGESDWSWWKSRGLWWIYGAGCLPAFMISARFCWKHLVMPWKLPIGFEDYLFVSLISSLVAPIWPAALVTLVAATVLSVVVKLSIRGLKT